SFTIKVTPLFASLFAPLRLCDLRPLASSFLLAHALSGAALGFHQVAHAAALAGAVGLLTLGRHLPPGWTLGDRLVAGTADQLGQVPLRRRAGRLELPRRVRAGSRLLG